MVEGQAQRDAIVFFARDFLAVEFARLATHFAGLARVYITVSQSEIETIRAADSDADMLCLHPAPPVSDIGDAGETEFNFDRFLRNMDDSEVRAVVAAVKGVVRTIGQRYRVRYYLDEPVSGYPNWEFNRAFAAAGATCLHFQPSWIPGYSFFTADPAQRKPVTLGVLSNGAALAQAHVAARAAGEGRPLYVLGYGKIRKRVTDWFKTGAKIGYRKLFRSRAAYIDRDPSEHRLHLRALGLTFVSRYSRDPATETGFKYVIFPLHYEPEAVLNYFSSYRRQEEVAAQLLDTLPLGYKLVLKEHPSQPGALHMAKWASLRESKRVVFLRGDYPAAKLMAHNPVVVSIGSTFALEAAIAGCPVGVLGGVHFENAPGITKLASPRDWPALVDAPRATVEQISNWYGDFIDRYCFHGNIMRGQTQIDDLPAVVAALEGVEPGGAAPARQATRR